MAEDRIFKDGVIEKLRRSSLHCIDVFAYSVTDSTNTRAAEYAREQSPDKITLFVADSQSAGRGRRGRSFDSPRGSGLYFSLLIPCDACEFNFTELTVRAAVAVRRAIFEISGIETGIKWVNDIILGGKKVSGILAEAVTSENSGAVEYAVLGIGINLKARQFPEEITPIATALETYAEGEIDRIGLLAEIIREILSFGDFSSVIEEYRRPCIAIGKTVLVAEFSGESYSALALDITDTGALRVLLDSGETRELVSAEVSVKIMNN